MEKFSKKLFASRVLDLGRKNRTRNQGSRKNSHFLEKLTEEKLVSWLKFGVIIIIPLIILTPEIRITNPAIRFDEILLGIGTFFYLILILKRKQLKVSFVDYLFGALFISTAASIIFSYVGVGYKFYLRDFFEFFKLIKYYLIYRIIYEIDWNREDARFVIESFLISAVLAILFGVMQYFNFFKINAVMTLYTKPVHIRAISVAGRIVGTFKNANSWALFLGTVLFFIFGDLIRSLGQKTSKKHLVVLLLLFITIASIIVTLSRTSIVANFIALGVISLSLWVFPYKKIGKPKITKEIFIVFMIFLIFSGLAFFSIELIPFARNRMNLITRFEAGLQEAGVLDEGTVEGDFKSWESRSEKWKNSIKLTLKSPLLGYGPSKSLEAKENVPYATDNEYILYFYRYGFLGLLIYVTFFGYWVTVAFLSIKNTVKKFDWVFSVNIIALGIAVSYPLYNILAGSFYDFQLFPLFMIFESLNLYFAKNYEKT